MSVYITRSLTNINLNNKKKNSTFQTNLPELLRGAEEMEYYFLPEDMVKLDGLIEKTRQDLEAAMQSIGGSADEGNNTWHDNPAYDEAMRQTSMWGTRLREWQNMRADCVVADPPRNILYVQIGHIVVIEDISSNERRTVRIGSHMCFREGENDITISYAAPLGQILMGARVGEIHSGKVAKGFKRFKILEIKLPEQK